MYRLKGGGIKVKTLRMMVDTEHYRTWKLTQTSVLCTWLNRLTWKSLCNGLVTVKGRESGCRERASRLNRYWLKAVDIFSDRNFSAKFVLDRFQEKMRLFGTEKFFTDSEFFFLQNNEDWFFNFWPNTILKKKIFIRFRNICLMWHMINWYILHFSPTTHKARGDTSKL